MEHDKQPRRKGLFAKVMMGAKKLAEKFLGKSDDDNFKPHLMGTTQVSMSDKQLPADVWAIKRAKLGSSFFTRRLNPRTRSRLISGLTAEEKEIARAKGWIK